MIIKNTYTEVFEECPICGSELEGTQYTDEIWGAIHLVESHTHCPKCSFRGEMCYSPYHSFICETDTVQNIRKAEELGIDIVSEDEYYRF